MAVPTCSEEDTGTVEIIEREADPMIDSLVEVTKTLSLSLSSSP